jgi:hypothetical protein
MQAVAGEIGVKEMMRVNNRLCHSRLSFVYFSPESDAAAVIRLLLPAGCGGQLPTLRSHARSSPNESRGG